MPGFWMLFVSDGFGLPSVAHTDQILDPECKKKG